MSPGNYSLKFSSATASGGNTDYFIKSGNFQTIDVSTSTTTTYDSSGNVIDLSTPAPTPTPTPTPEPTPEPKLNKNWFGKKYAHYELTKGLKRRSWSVHSRFRNYMGRKKWIN